MEKIPHIKFWHTSRFKPWSVEVKNITIEVNWASRPRQPLQFIFSQINLICKISFALQQMKDDNVFSMKNEFPFKKVNCSQVGLIKMCLHQNT